MTITLDEQATIDDWKAVRGTSLRGYITATRDEIEAVFGAPTIANADPDDKVTTEWYIIFDDKTVATIYDWKRYGLGAPYNDERIEWNVGGHNERALVLVAQAMGVTARAWL